MEHTIHFRAHNNNKSLSFESSWCGARQKVFEGENHDNVP